MFHVEQLVVVRGDAKSRHRHFCSTWNALCLGMGAVPRGTFASLMIVPRGTPRIVDLGICEQNAELLFENPQKNQKMLLKISKKCSIMDLIDKNAKVLV